MKAVRATLDAPFKSATRVRIPLGSQPLPSDNPGEGASTAANRHHAPPPQRHHGEGSARQRNARAGDCIEFAGPINSVGYGVASEFAGERLAHRVAWVRVFGPIADGKWVLHACDNRRCVRVDHLFLGDHAENMADRNAKGRQARGERHGLAKLTDAQAEEVRRRARDGELQSALAREFGVSRPTVSRIVSGSLRSGVTRPTPPAEAAVVAARMRAVRARRRAS